jgi:hypothetical protein
VRAAIRIAVLVAAILLLGREAFGQILIQKPVIYCPVTTCASLVSVSAAGASAPLLNVGQTMHVIKIEFPAEVATVSPIAVRLEFAYTCGSPVNANCTNGDWFQTQPDITEALALTGGVYAFTRSYGCFPFVRVRNVSPTPGGKLMTIRYAGHVLPIVPFLKFDLDRYVF